MKNLITISILLFIAFHAAAQTNNARFLAARILGEDGEPLVGVSVLLKNKSTGTSTDQNGYFILNLSNGDIVVLNYAGCETAEYTFEEIAHEFNNQIIFYDNILLPEVVVSAYGINRICGGSRCPSIGYPFPSTRQSVQVSLQGRNWQYYPNPTHNAVNVSTEEATGMITVYSFDGKPVAQINITESSTIVDLSRFSSGLYFLNYENNNWTQPIGKVTLIKE